MSGTADPHEPPPLPAFQHRVQRTPYVVRTDGPHRVYDPNADPTYEPPRIRGFGREVQVEDLAGLPESEVERACNEPQLWDGDQA